MADYQTQAALNQITQIAPEEDPGTPVAATRRLHSMAWRVLPQRAVQQIRPPGFKYVSKAVETRRWAQGALGEGGGIAYNEIIYALASILGKPVITRVGDRPFQAGKLYRVGDIVRPTVSNSHYYRVTVGGISAAEPGAWPTGAGATVVSGAATFAEAGATPVDAWEYEFDTSTFSKDDIQTYTVETGELGGRGYRAAHAFLTGLTLNSNRAGNAAVTGTVMAFAREAPFSLTTGPGVLEDEIIPATPADLNIYMDETAATLGNTLLDGNMSVELSLTDRQSLTWFHGRAYGGGPSGKVETPPDATFELVQADGTEVDDMVAALKAGEKRYLRFEFKGPQIEDYVGINHLLEYDVAGQVGDNETLGEEDNVWAATVPWVTEHAAALGRSQKARVITNVASL